MLKEYRICMPLSVEEVRTDMSTVGRVKLGLAKSRSAPALRTSLSNCVRPGHTLFQGTQLLLRNRVVLCQVKSKVTGQLADCQLADWMTRGLDISRTGQLAD